MFKYIVGGAIGFAVGWIASDFSAAVEEFERSYPDSRDPIKAEKMAWEA